MLNFVDVYRQVHVDIKYDGEYPNLCSGHLEVWVNGTYYDCGRHTMISGGYLSLTDCECLKGPWFIDFPTNIPAIYHQAILDKVNEVVPPGCCGGCL